MLYYLMDFLLVLPLILFFHQIGHGFGVRIFRGYVTEITIGHGNTIVSLGKLKLKSFIFMGGSFSYMGLPNFKPIKKIIILLLGSGFNLLTILLAELLSYWFEAGSFLAVFNQHFIYLSWLISLVALLPLAIGQTKLDGLQILELIKFQKHTEHDQRKVS